TTKVDQDPGLDILKTVTSVEDVNANSLTDAGDIIHYNVEVKNTGNMTLTNVNVSDPLTGDTLATGITMAPGADNNYATSYTIAQSDIDNNGNPAGSGKIVNTAFAGSDQTGQAEASITSIATQDVTVQPDLSITKTVTSVEDVNGNGLTDAGDIIHYNVEV